MTMYVELQAITNGIGRFINSSYVRESDADDCVKDIIKTLRRENETCDIRRFLGTTKVLQKDLIPLVCNYGSDDDELFDVAIRCLMNLTQPARIVFRNEVPKDKTTRHCYMEVESYLQLYKKAFVNRQLLTVIFDKMSAILALDWVERSEEQNVQVERILVLIRNVLHVPPSDEDKLRTDTDASCHDQLIYMLHEVGLDKLILYMAGSDSEKRFCIHVLEIVSLIFREQSPEQLAATGSSRSMREREQDEAELDQVAESERMKKRQQLLQVSARHSRFGGTYIMKGKKSISDNDIIYHRQLNAASTFTFDGDKKRRRKPKNRCPLQDDNTVRRSTLAIRSVLKDFCIDFIRAAYNPLMKSVKVALDNDATQENDDTYYLWSSRFFMLFQRLYHFDVELVRETMDIQTFHYVHTMLQNHQDMMVMDKAEAKTWGKRLHLALRTYKELLETLTLMTSSPSSQVREAGKVIQQNVFYLLEYRDVLVMLLRRFDQTRQSKSYLRDLIETVHLYVKYMDKWCASSGKVIVQRKVKRAVRQKKQKKKKPKDVGMSAEQLEQMWDEQISMTLSEILQELDGEIPDDITPFDAASDIPVDDQRTECVRDIHASLRAGSESDLCLAVGLLRAAREVWPDEQEFGGDQCTPEDEFMILREVFFADIQSSAPPPVSEEENEEDAGDLIEQEEMQAVEPVHVEKEQVLDFREFTRMFCNSKIVQVYALMLTQYAVNPKHTNHCLVKMLHRIAIEHKMVGMLYQLSLFQTFGKIFKDPAAKPKHFDEMKFFCTYVLKCFFRAAPKNPNLYVELLFWKNLKEAIEVETGYGSYQSASSKLKLLWSEEQEHELKTLYEQHKEEPGDIVDNILANLIDQDRTRRQVIRQLIHMDLATDPKQFSKKPAGRTNAEWTEDEVDQLKNHYEMFKEMPDIMGEIMMRMTNRTRNSIVVKLLELGVVEDRKQLRKRQSRKTRGRREDGSELSSSEESSLSSDDEAPPTSSQYGWLIRGEPEELIGQLREMGGDMLEAIQWLRRSFRRTAEDREEDDDELVATPLIPLQPHSEAALDNMAFQKFIYSIGVNPPCGAQETYWRISTDLTPVNLRELASAMDPDSSIPFPELILTYTIPSASRENRPKKKQRQKKRISTGAPRQSRAREREDPNNPPKSKEFISSSDSSSDDEPDRSKTKPADWTTVSNDGAGPSRLDQSRQNESSSNADSDDESCGPSTRTDVTSPRITVNRNRRVAMRRSSSDSGDSDDEDKMTIDEDQHELSESVPRDASDLDSASQAQLNNVANTMDAFPATLLTQRFPNDSDTSDDEPIASAVLNRKRKSHVLDDSDSE